MSTEYKLCACPLDCFDLCSMRAEIIDGKVTKLEGNKEHPITQGFICEKGRKHVERMYSPLRLTHPMKKVAGKFVEITWDEALDTIASKLKYYIDNYGTLSIAQFNDGGAGGQLKEVENLFFDYLGNITMFNGNLCWGAGIAAQQSDFGDVKGHSPLDIYNAKTIIIWGRNPIETNIHIVPFIKKAKEKGARIILIDPIVTATAAISDWHIKLKPKGDTAFACAVAKYIVENELYDKTFVEKHTKGFEEINEYLKTLDYNELYMLSGTEQETVASFAEAIVNKPATIYVGYGLQRYNNGGTTVRSIDMLGALSGNIGIIGGGVNYANKVYSSYINWEAVAPSKKSQHRYIAKPRFAAELSKLDNPKVKALFISRSNPVVQLPNSDGAAKAISSIEFKVVLDHFMTDTAQLADLILPVTYFMEETDLVYSSMWNGYIFYNQKLVSRYFEAKPEFEIYSMLAEKMNIVNFPQMNEEQWLNKLLSEAQDIGIDISTLKRNSYAYAELNNPVPWSDYRFKTSSGKFEFAEPSRLQNCFAKCETIDAESFRLLTVHGRESMHSQHLITSKIEHPLVYICREDAMHFNIKDKQLIELYNEYGSLIAEVCVSDNTQKGVLFMKEGWWKKNGGSVNSLTAHDVSDIGDQAIYNECKCKIRKQGA